MNNSVNLIESNSTIKKKRSLIKIVSKELYYLKQNSGLLTLALPAVVVIFLVRYLPMFGIIIAFKDYKYDLGILGSRWIGFKNFTFFFHSSDAFVITRNTLLYNIAFIVLGTFFSVLFAIFLNEFSKTAVKVYQTLLFIPHFLSWIVVGFISLALFDTQYGFINRHIITIFGVSNIEWFSTTKYWPFILTLFHLWKSVGFSALIYYTAIMGISSEYYEAAEIDGASKFQATLNITIPMLKKVMTILVVLALGNIFRGDFGLHFFVPNNSGVLFSVTNVIDTYAYRALRQNGDIPMASAVSAFQSIVGFITILVANYVVRKIESDNAIF